MDFLCNMVLIFILILQPSLIFADDPFSNVQLVIEDGKGSCKKEDHLSIKSEQEVSCPPQWFKASNNYCYEYHTQEANYVNAKSTCEKKGGTLAAAGIRDSSVRRELFKRINIGKYIWIGLDDTKKEKSFIWADGGSYVESKDTNWDSGQPDDDDLNEDCVHLSAKHGDWKLNDINCDSKLTYLCEKKL
ncbi:C-type lectin BML-2-like isoform X2 [Styela clava]